MKSSVVRSVVAACAVALAAAPAAVAFFGGAEVGKPAPAFVLKDQHGKTWTLADLAGKTVVLEWFNPDCPHVVQTYEKGLASATIEALKKDGALFIAVNSTGTAPLDEVMKKSVAFLERFRIDHPILFDHDGAIGRAYGALTTPHVFVIDGKGVLRYQGAFSNDPKFSGTNVTNYALAASQAIQSGTAPAVTNQTPWGSKVIYKASN
jgi:peroxiredoxin